MEALAISIDAEKFDQAMHGGLDGLPILPERGDLAVYVKRQATVQGKAAAVLTFTVQLPDGTLARAQVATTAALVEAAGAAVKGWREGGHI